VTSRFPFSFEVLIGDQIVRKIITSVYLTFKVNSSPHVPEELDVKYSLSLGHLDSFDQYEKPIVKETFASKKSIVSNKAQSYKLPFNPACYGFSSLSFGYSASSFSLAFNPLSVIPEHLCSPLYSRAFMVEF
jgi:hypothetical protein